MIVINRDIGDARDFLIFRVPPFFVLKILLMIFLKYKFIFFLTVPQC